MPAPPAVAVSKSWVRRNVGSHTTVLTVLCAFLGGILASYAVISGQGVDAFFLHKELSSPLREATTSSLFSTAPQPVNATSLVVHSDTSATDGFINAWRQDRETCEQWMSMQNMSRSYLDAYIIGSQKGATSEITKRFHTLGVRHLEMKKEWHYFTKLGDNGTLTKDIKTHNPVVVEDLKEFRYGHYLSGFPENKQNATSDWLPPIDTRGIDERILTYDSTVEHLHTDKAAFMAHALTPHARIVVTVRNPIDRAISQFNMVVRSYNKGDAARGRNTRKATPEWFHEVVSNEIEKITGCGYDAGSATIDRPTSKMLICVFGEGKVKFENLLYVTRGLYHIHIATWRNYFPDHRILILSFSDITSGKRETHNDLTRFLCIRPFPEELLTEYEENASNLSYGQQAAKGIVNKGTDLFDKVNDTYMADINPDTRKMLEDFYRPANRKLEALLGRKMYEYEG